MSQSHRTQNHDTIRAWAEARDGRPAKIVTREEGGLLRIDFGEPDEDLIPIAWDEFFLIFDDAGLDFLYQDRTEDGGISRFGRFVAG